MKKLINIILLILLCASVGLAQTGPIGGGGGSGGAGDDLGNATASDVIELWASGSCSGYLYSDGTCSDPSGVGDDLGDATAADIVALFDSGSCSGFLLADETCDDSTYLTAEVDTMSSAFGRGKSITGANSLANALRVGDSTNQWCFYRDSVAGLQLVPCTAADTGATIMTNYIWSLYDQEADADIETVDPDAATIKGIWTYGTAYKPRKSIDFSAGALSTDGTQCAAPAEVTINSGAKRWTVICADNDASTAYGEIVMPDSWDASTVTFEGSFVQTAADTAVLNSDIATACRTPGDTINNTWGTEVAMDIAAMGGSNKLDQVTSGAVTANGTCHAGDLLQFRWQLDATGTTTAVATLHVLNFKMVYSVTSRSD